MSDMVGIVIVSHSKDIAKGTADMVRQMVGSEVKVAFCGGNPDGGLGTSVAGIIEAIDAAWSAKGVAILVDLGGAETNSEMAIDLLEPARRERQSCDESHAERKGPFHWLQTCIEAHESDALDLMSCRIYRVCEGAELNRCRTSANSDSD